MKRVVRAALAAASLMLAASCGVPGGSAGDAPPAEIDPRVKVLPAPWNTANYARGGQLFRTQCTQCHTLAAGGPSVSGPNLHGVVGRPAGTLAAYDSGYSSVLKGSGIVWDAEKLNAWLESPQTVVPGNRMGYAGLADAKARLDLIGYLLVETKAE